MFCLPWEREGRTLTDEDLLERGKAILRSEASEIDRAADRAGMEFVRAARIIQSCRGRLVVVGMGKSGIIGRKIAATLASLGTPSFFLHAAEGSHGDLGMVCRDDAALILSNSGTTAEVVSILPHFKRLGAPIIAITGGLSSPLAQNADVVLDSSVLSEAGALRSDPLGRKKPGGEQRRPEPRPPVEHHPPARPRRRPRRDGHRAAGPLPRGFRPLPSWRSPGPQAPHKGGGRHGGGGQTPPGGALRLRQRRPL
ncbi:hypothetical protein MASR2M79_22750 [Aminivibrio sp.]